MNMASFHAVNRFGLGPAPGEVAEVQSDPRGWLHAQIGPHHTPRELARFRSSDDLLTQIFSARRGGAEAVEQAVRDAGREAFNGEIMERTRVMATTRKPFAERMVLFWSNHFTVSNTRGLIGPSIPAYEREAIRPHIFGRFVDMLKASARHPAMLTYLDNVLSVGDNSPVGQRRRRNNGSTTTLNENLAREILELHTLGVGGGYTQRDVVEFAKAITGWGHGGLRGRQDERPVHGRFEFNEEAHEPGHKVVLGRHYREQGEREGIAILEDLARHPSTARFIATKLARHFVSDNPPEGVITALSTVFRATDGDLAAVSRALIDMDAPWITPLAKAKSHYEYLVSVHRAAAHDLIGNREVSQPLREMAHLPFTAPSPAGWGDTTRDWIAPQALMRRIEWVRRFTAQLPAGIDPMQAVHNWIGPFATEHMNVEIGRAPSGDEALALILSAPEFHRR